MCWPLRFVVGWLCLHLCFFCSLICRSVRYSLLVVASAHGMPSAISTRSQTLTGDGVLCGCRANRASEFFVFFSNVGGFEELCSSMVVIHVSGTKASGLCYTHWRRLSPLCCAFWNNISTWPPLVFASFSSLDALLDITLFCLPFLDFLMPLDWALLCMYLA